MVRQANMSIEMMVGIVIVLIFLAIILYFIGVQSGLLDRTSQGLFNSMRWSP